MQRGLELKLFGAQAAGAEGVVFVDEFHGDDRGGLVEGARFADAGSLYQLGSPCV